MKKKIKTIIVGAITLVILSALCLGLPCSEPVECEVSFEYDPNQVNYRIVGSYIMRMGQTLVHDFNSCDPDDDNIAGLIHEILSGPVGMVCTLEGRVTYSPESEGLKYPDFSVKDSPPDGLYGTDEGTMIIWVLPAINKPPVLGGCSTE